MPSSTTKINSPALLAALRMALFAAAVIFLGHFIAKEIFDIPSRKDILIFITLALFIPVLKFPISGVYFLFLIPPFIAFVRRFYYLFYERPGNDLLLIIPDVVVVLLCVVLFDRIRKGERIKNEDRGLVIWLWVFIFYQFLRVFVANGSGWVAGINQFKFITLFSLCFFFAMHFIREKRQVITIFKLTFWLGVIIAAYGIKQAYFGFSHFEELWLEKMKTTFVTLFLEGKPRPFSTLPSPATFADFMVIAILVTMSLLSLKQIRFKPLYFIFIPLMFVALLLTSVRSNWIGFLVGVVFWFIIAHRSSIRFKIGMVAFLVLLYFFVSVALEFSGPSDIAAIAGVQAMQGKKQGRKLTDILVTDRVSALTNPLQERSMIARSTMWKFVLETSLQLPMGPMGWGMGSFNAHSYYFSTLYDLGYFGLFLLCMVLFRIFRVGYRVYRDEEEPEKRVIIRCILSVLFVITVMNATGSHIGEHPADVYYWFMAGILMVIRRLKSGKDDESERLQDAIVDPT
jgi:hypothetical protein